jgi:hypothetical protein
MRRYYPLLLKAFTKAHGVGAYYWCADAEAAAALTRHEGLRGSFHRSQHVWLRFNPTGHWRAGDNVLAACIALNQEIEYHLRGGTRRRWQVALYEIITATLAILDDREAEWEKAEDTKQTGGRPNCSHFRAKDGVDTDGEYMEGRLGQCACQG